MDRKCKIEEACDLESETQSSPLKKLLRHTLDFKLKMISEVKTSNISVFARKYSILRSCICEWRKDEKNISEVLKSQTKSCTSKIDGTRNTITKFRLAGRGRKVLDQNNYKNGSTAAASIEVPSMFVFGSLDKMVNLDSGKKFSQLIKNSFELIIF